MAFSARGTRRSRIAHFKAPFVVAVLAPVAALDAGCGARADRGGGSLGATPDATTGAGQCPERAPAVGSACGHEGLTCEYSDNGAPCSYPNRRCQGGAWRRESYACNPPPPSIETCPETPPPVGSSCARYPAGLECEYPYCYGTVPQARCDEVSSLWTAIELPSCNPPAPDDCPPDAPAIGSECYSPGQRCLYGSCGDAADPRRDVECAGEVWSESAPSACTSAEPDAGAGVDAGAADGGPSNDGVADAG